MKSLWSKRRVLDDSYSSEVTMYAFPNQHNPQTGRQETGMLLRDYFAATALQALLWHPDKALDDKEDVVTAASEYADEMLRIRGEL